MGLTQPWFSEDRARAWLAQFGSLQIAWEFADSPAAREHIAGWVKGLLKAIPALSLQPDYLSVLLLTGGAYIHDEELAISLIGFGDHVPSFNAGFELLEEERFFVFMEVKARTWDHNEYLALDVADPALPVVIAPAVESPLDFRPFCTGFGELPGALLRHLRHEGEQPR